MRGQWARMAAGLVALGMASASATAQPPADHAIDSSRPPDSSYLSRSDDAYYDNLETGWQFRFQADWVALKRTNRADDLPSVTGPDTFRLKDIDFNYTSGYRLNLGFMNDDYELEGSFLELDGLGGTRGGILGSAVLFDGSTTYLAPGTSVAARTAVDAASNPNFLSAGSLFSPLNTAANTNIVGTDESTELEFLQAGGSYAMRYDSSLQDFDVNFKGRRQPGRLFRFGVGYRNIQFREFGRADMRGLFDTVDVDDGLEPDLNDGLSDEALTGAGLTNVAGAGFTDTQPPPGTLETLLFTTDMRTQNQLNGVQLTCDATFFESDYFEFGGFARAGLFHNRGTVSYGERYLDVTSGAEYRRSFRDEKDGVAFAGNLGLTGLWIVRENFRIFASYETMLLSGVALAPDQSRALASDIAGNTYLDARMNGSAFFHGGRVGFEILLP